MQLRKVSKRLLVAVVALLLPLHVAAQSGEDAFLDDDGGLDEDLLEEPVVEEEAMGLGEDPFAEPDWVTSLRLSFGIDVQGARANTDAANVTTLGGRVSFIGTSNFPADGAAVGGGLEIMGPPIGLLPGKPRPFLSAGLRDQVEGFTTIGREQSRGSRTSTRIRLKLDLANERWYFAGLGLAFRLPFDSFNIKFKPSVGWVMLRSMARGRLIQPTILADGRSSNSDFVRDVLVQQDQHGIVPKVEFDAEVYRRGPIAVGLFAEVEGQYFLTGEFDQRFASRSCGGRITNCAIVDATPATDPAPFGEAQFRLRKDKYIIYGGVGLRVSWLGL